ncbi:Leucine-rich receptor-like protein kinase family protein [Rhynchospora pubera]|uniref:non-specific serine/threonine protein kinase n=1 Tax=Rhynchospora pubera TaxID=906938 RepID=A0AAV8G770_9POAL|nr:Leucine-rich receptor-like protein kinase family protein [Rhynchospora pubera]
MKFNSLCFLKKNTMKPTLCFLLCFFLLVARGQEMNQSELLLEFKMGLIDTDNHLWNWGNSSYPNPCNWNGIACANNSEVISVTLHDLNLQGNLSTSPALCHLPLLTIFNVSKNSISGPVPAELSYCTSLEVLDLSTNRLHGTIPIDLCDLNSLKKLFLSENYLFDEIPQCIGNLTSLEELVIYSNNLTGLIPPSIRMLKELRIIRAGVNDLSGPIPVEISECYSLEILGLAQNQLEGTLPTEIGLLKNLTTLILWQNELTGEIPAEIGNCTSLEMISINDNRFTGGVPKELGYLPMLTWLYIYRNQLDGIIPPELVNCTSAIEIDLSENHLTGTIPRELGNIPNLKLLYLFENLLIGTIPPELGTLTFLARIDLSINNLTGTIPMGFHNLTNLEYLQLFDNNLHGSIPPLLGANTNLSVLDVSDNSLTNTIPPFLCKYQKLVFLSLGSNQLTGHIPYGVRTCKPLVQLRLGGNLLTGSFPVELAGLTNLSALELDQNRFSGPILPEIGNFKSIERLILSDNYFIGQLPDELGELSKLVAFNVSSNQLSGMIPRKLANCSKLQRLDLSRNRFTGTIPVELGKLVSLEILRLSDNSLNGSVPSSLGELERLTELQLGGNAFTGPIPVELGQLMALQMALNLSYNSLSGTIPPELGNLRMLEFLYFDNNKLEGAIPNSFSELSSLIVCNLSYNSLVGPVPRIHPFENMDSTNFLGNAGLCGFRMRPCENSQVPSNAKKSTNADEAALREERIVTFSCAIVGAVGLFLIGAICWSLKRQFTINGTGIPPEDRFRISGLSAPLFFTKQKITYQELIKGTCNFSENAVIGRGACGTVFKAVLSDGAIIAVKRLKSQGEGSNMDRSFCTEISTLGNVRHRNIVKLFGFCSYRDSNFILYEYMANGSLGEILHGSGKDDTIPALDWDARYRIALGAAEGLRYLHTDCKPRVVHRDIKSNNILLDEEMEAHVGDFGLAKLIDLSNNSKTMSAVAGSYGYIAPEYAFTMKVTEKCDIYSFGVVLLELVTGQSPIQPLEKGGDLVNLVRRLMLDHDPESPTVSGLFDARLDLKSKSTIEEMFLVLKIALFCTSESPTDRPSMREVICMLIDARVLNSSNPDMLLSSPNTSDSTLEEGQDEEDASLKGNMKR